MTSVDMTSKALRPNRFRRKPRTLAGIALAGACALAVAGCGTSSNSPTAKSSPVSDTGVFPGTTTTSSPATPTPTPSETDATAPAEESSLATVTADDAYLQPLQGADPIAQPATDKCQLLHEYGWTVTQCVSSEEVAYVVEKKAVQHKSAWRFGVLQFEDGTGWVPVLGYADDTGDDVTTITLRTTDLDGNGLSEGVVGFRHQGTGDLLAYDILSGTEVVGHRGDLAHGIVTVNDDSITEVSAQYPNDEPNCCPAYLQRTVITASGARITAQDLARLDPATSPAPGNL